MHKLTVYACQLYANMRLLHISLISCIFQQSAHISYFFPHKLALSTAILLLFVFLLPISIRFRYLDHLVANRMAPSMCPDPCGTRWGSWFQAILCHISAYFHRIFGVYAVRIFFKCRIKLTCLTRQNRQIFVEDVSWHASREAHAVTLEKNGIDTLTDRHQTDALRFSLWARPAQ